MNTQSRVILATQWKMLMNFYRRHGQVGFVISSIVSLIWYSSFILLAVLASNHLAHLDLKKPNVPWLGIGFFFAFIYWQGMPLAMASVGGLLDIRKLKAFPVSSSDLFRLELLLRTLIFAEMPILMIGCSIGLLFNPALHFWSALVPILFAVFNITLGAGIKDLILRLMSRKGVREFWVLGLILLIALPSVIARRGMKVPKELDQLISYIPFDFLPWIAAAQSALSVKGITPWLVLIGFTVAGWYFGKWQFVKNFNADPGTVSSTSQKDTQSRFAIFFTWPNRIFSDPLAAIIEKEIRFLSRVSRFRTVFMMGFTFGLLIWLPMVNRNGTGWISQNYLVMISGYALLLLSGVCFYNCFGFDRSATQFYFVAPVKFSTVLLGKNITTVFFVVLEIILVVLACIVFQMQVSLQKVIEAVCVCIVMTLGLLALGNMTSVTSPRAVNPGDSWKNNSSKAAWVTILFYPMMSIPVGLAYLARWAFRTELAFYIVIGCGIFLAASFYWVALSSTLESLEEKQEEMLTLLSQNDSPVL